jgi:hypothetical protein
VSGCTGTRPKLPHQVRNQTLLSHRLPHPIAIPGHQRRKGHCEGGRAPAG